MIILITEMYQLEDEFGYPVGKAKLYVSHGVDSYTGNNVVLPFETLTYFKSHGAVFNDDLYEWVME